MPVFDRGDRVKWTDLATQAESGHAGKCQGSTWQEDYRKMHAEVCDFLHLFKCGCSVGADLISTRKMLEGKRNPHFITYHCER